MGIIDILAGLDPAFIQEQGAKFIEDPNGYLETTRQVIDDNSPVFKDFLAQIIVPKLGVEGVVAVTIVLTLLLRAEEWLKEQGQDPQK